MKSLILAGGFGTRLRSVVEDVPKPMAYIAGKPFLEHQIRYLKNNGIDDIVLGVHYKADVIKSYFGNGLRFDCNITYSEEDSPLGTGGAIKLAQKYIGDDAFLVLNGDSYSNVRLKDFIGFHESHEGTGSMVLTKASDSSHYGLVKTCGSEIISFGEKCDVGSGEVNAGVYIFEPEIFDYIAPSQKVSLESDVFPGLAKKGELFAFNHNGYFMDIGRPETYFRFKQDFLQELQSSKNIDVREAMRRMWESDSNILFMVGENDEFLGLLTDKIIKKHIIAGGALEERVSEAMIGKPKRLARVGDSEDLIKKYLQEGTNSLPVIDDNERICDIRFRNEEIKPEGYPVVRGKSPLRISFAGGGTDMPHFFEEHGGAVISTTIDKYCNVTAKKRGDSKLVIDSDITNGVCVFDGNDLKYDGNFDLVKAVYNLVSPGFGVDLYLDNDVPPGRGLGSSGSFAVLLTKVLGSLKGVSFDDDFLIENAYNAETSELEIRGGKQDQSAAALGGFNWIEFGNGNKKIIHPLRIRDGVRDELLSHLTLCYTGGEHESDIQQMQHERRYMEKPHETVNRLNAIRDNAKEVKECLLSANPDFERIGSILHQSWLNKKKLSGAVSNPGIDRLYNVGFDNGAYGGKLLGSGGGGYILFAHPPRIRNKLERILVDNGGDLLGFNFEDKGARIWNV